MTTLGKLVRNELSGSSAKNYVSHISSFHRIQGSPMFREALEWVRREAESIGLEDLTVESFPADGEQRYWTYYSPPGWRVRGAELRMVEPEERLLARFDDTPQSLHTFSKGTPPEGVTAELIDVGSGLTPKDYEGKDVTGKIVLASGRGEHVHGPAVVQRGAAGVVTDSVIEMPHVRESVDVPDAHGYQGIWPKARDMPKTRFGFSVSKRQGTHLRDLLRDGKTVKLLAHVDAELFPGTLDLLTGVIKGCSKPYEEIVLMAHLCHPKPSANDNASGCACLLEVARTICALVRSGKVKPPARTIRFMWMPETNGSVAYLSSHEDARSRIVAGINLDMVGEDQELCRSTLNIDSTPDSMPSYLNDFVYSMLEQSVREYDTETHFGHASTFRFALSRFSGGSDHTEFNEAGVGVPCVMLLQWPDMFYHTSMDTIDKVSEDSLRRVGWSTAMAAITLADADALTALRLASLTRARGAARLAKAADEAAQDLLKRSKGNLGGAVEYHKDRIRHIAWREQGAVRSVRRLVDDDRLDTSIAARCGDLADIGSRELAHLEDVLGHLESELGVRFQEDAVVSPAEQEARRTIPRKLFKGTLCSDVLKESLSEDGYRWHAGMENDDVTFSVKMVEALNFADGRRTVSEITKAISSEYSMTDVAVVLRYLKDLESIGLVELGRSQEDPEADL
jgi:hypothetical protein